MKKRFFNLSAGLVAVLILLIFLHSFGVTASLEGILQKVANPVTEKFYSWGRSITGIFSGAGDLDLEELERQNKNLESELNKALTENAKLKILAQENESLKKQLNFLKENEYDAVNARIISKDYYLPHSIIINKGKKDGISAGMPVIAEDGIIVGKITEIQENSSTAVLLTSRQSRLAATIITPDKNANGLVVGEHNLTVTMDLIPKGIKISRGDPVTTSGLEELVPAGLLVGSIESVSDVSGGLFQNAVIKPRISYNNLKFVSVLKSQ